METIEPNTPPQIAICDADHIADVIDGLSYNTHTLSVSIADSDMLFPVSVRNVDPQLGQVCLTLLDAQSLEASAVFDQRLALRAVCDTEELLFDELETLLMAEFVLSERLNRVAWMAVPLQTVQKQETLHRMWLFSRGSEQVTQPKR